MKKTKRIMSIILLLTLFVGMIPTNVNATETQTTVENSGTTIEGTNSFGSLLSEDIQEQQAAEEENYSGGYNVIGLTVENGIATVEYDTLEEAVLVVSLYSEDGLQLLISGNTVVQPESTEAEIALEGEIPEYFMASAYLLDTYDYSPLCESYDTPMYTQEMQELLASTTDDYDADKVLNLDDDSTKNFAVYADTTKVIEYTEGVNTVVSADDETATYVIENADENITSLQVGDVFVYPYEDNQMLIVKIAALAVEGTTVTITGTDLEMEEVFSHVKIESESSAEDFTVDESTAGEGVTFDGISGGTATYAARSGETDVGTSASLSFTLDQEVKAGDAAEVSVKVKGTLKMEIKVSFSYYVSSSRQFFEFKTDLATKASVGISGKLEIAIPLPGLSVSPVPGVGIGFTPKFKVEVSGKIEISASLKSTVGVSYENGKGFQSLNTSPIVETETSVEGTVLIGLDLFPNANVLGGTLIEIGFSAPVGFELTAELTGTSIDNNDPDAESIHTCEECLEMELVFKGELSAKLTLFKMLTYEHKLLTKEYKLADMYWSLDNDEFGWGTCPYISYRVTVYVKDSNNRNAVGTEVVAGCAEQLTEIPMGTTNSNGVVVDYLQAGTYTFMATVDGENLGKAVTIEEACKVTLDKDSVGGVPTFISGIVNADSITDNGIVASGECGADGSNVTWTLYGSGLLSIVGTGDMETFSSTSKIPWYNYALFISRVVIGNGVTSIGSRAFYNCSNVKQVDIPESVLSIGTRAFYGCSSLSKVEIPENVSIIESYSFYKCTNLTTVILHDNITTIEDRAFSGCEMLNNITIPSGVSFIGYYAFYNCDNLNDVYASNLESWCAITFDGYYSNPVNNDGRLYFDGEMATSVTLPDSIGVVNDFLFHGCTSITNVNIPKGITEIGAHAFEGCDNLITVSIPDSVTSIGGYAFCSSGITSLYIPDGVPEIPDLLCQWSKSLTRVIVGKGVTSIGVDAFAYTNLEEIVFKGDAPTTIEYGAFRTISPTGYYPMDNATWTAFLEDYSGNITWVPYTAAPFSLDVISSTQDTSNVLSGVDHNSDVVAGEDNTSESVSLLSIWGGEYDTEITDTYTLKTASFSGLVPGEQYVLLALVSIQAEDILAPDNLLYIDQEVAAEDGTLVFSYVQREVTDTSYVMACGASHNDLSEAVITFPSMMATEETQAVHPTVVYDGETLTEGVDYVVVGTVDYTTAGEYTCYVRGIYNYTGLVQCQYIVLDTAPGDVDDDGEVSDWDAIMLNRYLAGWSVEINLAAADVDGDGEVSDWDAIILERYLAGWDVKLES